MNSELDSTCILSWTTDWVLESATIMAVKPCLRDADSVRNLWKKTFWKGGVSGGNEAAFQLWFMNRLSFSLHRRPGCSCSRQIPNLITKTEHVCKSLESGRSSSGREALWKYHYYCFLHVFSQFPVSTSSVWELNSNFSPVGGITANLLRFALCLGNIFLESQSIPFPECVFKSRYLSNPCVHGLVKALELQHAYQGSSLSNFSFI